MPHSHALIVEDESFIAELYAAELRDHNMQVTIAEDAHTALELLRDKNFSIVLLDILLPDMSGIELMEQASSFKKKLPPVVVLSNLGKEIPRATWKKCNIQAYLVKSDVLAGAVWGEVKKYLG